MWSLLKRWWRDYWPFGGGGYREPPPQIERWPHVEAAREALKEALDKAGEERKRFMLERGELTSFKPRTYDLSKLSGYVRYTDTYAALSTALRYLERLPDDKARIQACAFGYGYLSERLAPSDESIERSISPKLPDRLIWMGYFGWLESLHDASTDNTRSHSDFVASALQSIDNEMREGRSVSLQRQHLALPTKFFKLSEDRRAAKLAEHRRLKDLDPGFVAPIATAACSAGRAMGAAHNRDDQVN